MSPLVIYPALYPVHSLLHSLILSKKMLDLLVLGLEDTAEVVFEKVEVV